MLLQKISLRKARIGVIGLGYVGLPLIIEFHKAGFAVTGFDVDEKKIQALREGRSYIKHVDIAPLRPSADDSTSFEATSDFSLLRNMDCILICVPTPLNKNREPDMRFVFDTTETIARYLRQGQLIILESTTYPGTTDKDMRAILERTGLKAGKDFHLAFSPEREDPNNKDFSLRTVPKVVGGFSRDCLNAAQALYDTIVLKTVPVSSTRAAEATKLLENIYRSVNIALVNELKMLFDKMDIDIWEVIEAAKTKPFGFQAFYPGPGLGGHCIPIDPFYLTWKAREYDVPTRFIELAGEINTAMPDYVTSKVVAALNDTGKPIKGTKILLLGLAYKANVDDDRESPSYRLIDKLEAMGATVFYNDPYVPEIRPSREFAHLAGRKSVDILDPANPESAIIHSNGHLFDLILVATAHDAYRGIKFSQLGIPVVDTRNVAGVGANIYRS